MMKKHLEERWLKAVKTRMKTVEGRIKKGDWEHVKVGDKIIFYGNIQDEYYSREVTVTNTKEFKTFEAMYEHYEERLLPGCSDLSEAKRIYQKIYGDADIIKIAIEFA